MSLDLHERIRRVSESASASGALWITPTEFEFVADAGVDFRIYRILDAEQRKQRRATKRSQKGRNPFLPYEADLFVADVSASHVCLLNKFNIVHEHALIVTREFVSQLSPLDQADFAALLVGLSEVDGLAFYNAGEQAGASQPHKHLQLVPLPLAKSGVGAPIDVLFKNGEQPPFRHAFRNLDDTSPTAEQLLANYIAMMGELDLDPQAKPTEPYNLLVTRRWMLLVPRTREKFKGISLNSLAFAGVLLARTDEQLETFKTKGPMTALRRVTE